MNKPKFIKRIVSLLLTSVMIFGTFVSVYAEELTSSNETHEYVIDVPNNMVVPMINDNESAYIESIPSGSVRTAVAYLDSYVGLYKTINVSLLCASGTTGFVEVKVTNSSTGEQMGTWYLTPNDPYGEKTIFLPKSGNYVVWARNGTNNIVAIVAYWE